MLNLEPALIWKHFEALSRIPRCSGNERGAAEYVLETGRRLGLDSRIDDCGNVVIRKGAAGRGKGKPGVVLQAHLDMVCEKTPDAAHDFAHDPIVPVAQNGWVCAIKTSLGADNGIGVAAGLAILEEEDVEHPPLEMLATVEEEIGLKGAASLTADFVAGRRLVNLDGEEEGTILIGCAGGLDVYGERIMPCHPHVMVEGSGFKVTVDGLKGGHSGIDINKGRGNAIKTLAHALLSLVRSDRRVMLVSLRAGSKSNAIPRYAEAELFLQGVVEHGAMEAWADDETRRWKAFLTDRDPQVALSVESASPEGLFITEEGTRRILEFLVASPHGVAAVDPDMNGMVETSSNLAIAESRNGRFKVLVSLRSSRVADLDVHAVRTESLMRLIGLETTLQSKYPPWPRELESPLLRAALAAHQTVLGTTAKATTIHAGLECGILAQRLPGLSAISIGPRIVNPHSPDEAVEVTSVDRFWAFLRGLLRALANSSE